MNKAMKSKVFKVHQRTSSIRGTIPQGVVESLKLSHGDTLNWSIEVREGKIVAVVEKAREV